MKNTGRPTDLIANKKYGRGFCKPRGRSVVEDFVDKNGWIYPIPASRNIVRLETRPTWLADGFGRAETANHKAHS